MTDGLHTAERIPGHIITNVIMEPGGGEAWEVRAGQVLRIVDIKGQQVADLVCFNLHRLEEKLSPQNTISLNRTLRPTVGHSLWSDEANRMMTFIADTVGCHDLVAGACSRYTNKRRYNKDATPNCRDNLAAAVRPWGLSWKDVPYNLNVFMNVPIGPDYSFSIEPPISRAGDYVDLRADMDVLVAISNCPQVLNPCNNFSLKPLQVVIYEPGLPSAR